MQHSQRTGEMHIIFWQYTLLEDVTLGAWTAVKTDIVVLWVMTPVLTRQIPIMFQGSIVPSTCALKMTRSHKPEHSVKLQEKISDVRPLYIDGE
jgi:hypothetical protein